jgi:predicted amidohydrolase
MSGPRTFLAACVQMTSGADLGKNLETIRRLVGEAAGRGAQLVVLPENFAFMGLGEAEKLAVAEPLGAGPIQTQLADVARSSAVWLVAGGMPERIDGPEGSGTVHNTCLVYDPTGERTAVYRKVHIFDVHIAGAAEFMESRTVAPGTEVVVAETALAKVGLSICYDVRFPELYRELGRRGARIVVVPAAFTLHTGKDHWHALLRARAIENEVYVLAAAQFGRSNEKRVCYGHSVIIDPWGTVVAEAPDRACVVVAEIDLDFQDKVRRELPCLDHRRL